MPPIRRIHLSGLMLASALLATPALAQHTMSREDVKELRANLLVDLENMRTKFIALAEAFPAEKYSWRPMDGVRSVGEVLLLAADEGFDLIPTSFGGMKGDAMKGDAMKGNAMKGDAMKGDAMKGDAMKGDAMKGDAMKGNAMKGDAMKGGAMRMDPSTDKAHVLDQLRRGFAHAKSEIERLDANTLGGSRMLFGKNRSATEVTLLFFGDMHEHLGQAIAYARMHQIVPPWSKGGAMKS